jgi:hypothetical protein
MSKGQPKNSLKKPLDNYIRFSAMGLQMGAIILILTYAGIKIDHAFTLKFPIFTLLFACSSVALALWYFIRQIINKQ